ALLVFDEVITGFRVARGGAQARFDVLPDLTILGKILGGGLPLAAFGGRAELMSELAPAGQVYQAGTLSGNPLATAAGLSVLRRARGRGDRPHDRGGPELLRSAGLGMSVWDTIAAEAAHESPLWGAALRPDHQRELVAVFSPLTEDRFRLGLETIYEGYLLHY